MTYSLTEASFLKNVAAHEMIIVRDEGLYRNIRFSKPGTWCMGFDITTWPGFLCFSGDVGCYVFSRLPDMFEFFRYDHKPDRAELYVNPGYWGEKLKAVDVNSPEKEYSSEKFKAAIRQDLKERKASRATIKQVVNEVLTLADDGEHEAKRAAIDFESDDGFRFDDFWEHDCRDYTHQYLWCCYALAWAVRKYDGRVVAGVERQEQDQGVMGVTA